ncbi:hypothetical protein FB385_0612 [Paramicrobacterium agarici]|nr:hypothetical protein FB385_0612 [Microbacterium agarici]
MTLHWREHGAARGELLDALVWYEDQEAGLGDRLADKFAESIHFIRQWPHSAPPYHGHVQAEVVRSKGLDGFPFAE